MKSVTIEISDKEGKVIRSISSPDPIPEISPEALTVLPGWVRPAARPGTTEGSHRFVWDLRPTPPSAGASGRGQFSLPISAIWGDTPIGAQSAMVEPGRYTVKVRLQSDAFEVKEAIMQGTLEVKRDPRLPP